MCSGYCFYVCTFGNNTSAPHRLQSSLFSFISIPLTSSFSVCPTSSSFLLLGGGRENGKTGCRSSRKERENGGSSLWVREKTKTGTIFHFCTQTCPQVMVLL